MIIESRSIKLSIVIPQYKECEDDMLSLAESISVQVGIGFEDIEVIIVNDCGKPIQSAEDADIEHCNLACPDCGVYEYGRFSKLPCKVLYISTPVNSGPGVARQVGIDNASGEYLIFIDADDQLYSSTTIYTWLDAIKNYPDADLITSNWVEEVKVDGETTFFDHGQDVTWMFGKLFRRQALIDTGVKFHPELRVHEDSYFLSCFAAHNRQTVHIDNFTYIWKYNEDSTVRKNEGAYTFNSMPEFTKALALSTEYIAENVETEPVYQQSRIVQSIFYHYFNFMSPNWQAQTEYRVIAETTLAKLFKPFLDRFYYPSSLELRAEIYAAERARSFKGFIEPEPFDQWFNRLFG